MNITHSQLLAIKPNTKPLSDGTVSGLMYFPKSKKTGEGYWKLRYQSPTDKTKRCKKTLGHFPELGVKEARQKALEFLAQLEEMYNNPSFVKKIVPTFKDAATKVHERLLPKWRSEKHAQQWINTLEQYAFPILGDKPLDEITVKNIAAVLFPIWIEKAETAVRLKQRIAEVLKWGMGYGYCDTNVALLVEPLLPIQESRTQRVEHQPALPFEKIPDFLKQHNITTKPTNITKALMLFLILTACRSGEARGATWAEIDFEDCVWTIPKERMKSGKEHRIPLSNQALCLLRELQQLQLDMNLIFPNRKGSALSDMVLTSFLRKKNVESDNPNRTATAHGFRSSFRNWCSENDVSSDIAERCLAHTISNRVEAAYNRTKLLDKRRPVMQDWADFVCSQIMPE